MLTRTFATGSASVIDYNAQIGSKELTGAFGCFQANSLLSGDGSNTLPVLIEALLASGKKVSKLTIGVPEDFAMPRKRVCYSSTLNYYQEDRCRLSDIGTVCGMPAFERI